MQNPTPLNLTSATCHKRKTEVTLQFSEICAAEVAFIVAHVCGNPLSRYTCRATRVATDFLRVLGFFRCSSSIAPPPPLKNPVAPVALQLTRVSHVKLPLKGVALQGGVAATLAGVALHCAPQKYYGCIATFAFCNAEVIFTEGCSAANEELQCNIAKTALAFSLKQINSGRDSSFMGFPEKYANMFECCELSWKHQMHNHIGLGHYAFVGVNKLINHLNFLLFIPMILPTEFC